MSTDRRELICARLLTLAQGIPGINQAVRNQVDETARTGPKIVIWDGDEAVSVQKPGGYRAVGATAIVELTPEIRICVEGSAANVGAALNGLRLALVAAIYADGAVANQTVAGTLANLFGTNGDLRYDGCTNQLERGQRVEGRLSLQFAITYPLIAAELT